MVEVMIDSTSRLVPYPGNDTSRRYGNPMTDATALLAYLRDELQRSGHAEVVEVSDLDAPGVRVDCGDGSKLFAKVAWAGRAEQTPHQPSWPTREDLGRGARR